MNNADDSVILQVLERIANLNVLPESSLQQGIVSHIFNTLDSNKS